MTRLLRALDSISLRAKLVAFLLVAEALGLTALVWHGRQADIDRAGST